MRRILGICVALCLGFVGACAEVNVLIPSHSGPIKTPPIIEKPPISLDTLKQMQAKKQGQMPGQRGLATPCDRNGSKTLDVNHQRQQTPAWCWAATSRMVMEYQNRLTRSSTDTQCAIVKNVLGRKSGRANCCEVQVSDDWINAPANCERGEWPHVVFERYGFNYEVVERQALDWESLTNEICGNGPFIYVVDLQGGGRHAFVAKGYYTDPELKQQFVEIYDPNQGDFQDQVYDEYAGNAPNKSYGTTPHYRDYVQISPKAEDQP